MADNSERDPGLPATPDPSDFPLGSPESRAAARLLLENGRRTPHVICGFVKPNRAEPEGPLLGPPIPLESNRATVHCYGESDKIYDRRPSESQQEFWARVEGDLPVCGGPRVVYFDWLEPKQDNAA